MKYLVIGVHPDDETLGCGGTLLRAARAGDEIHWLLVTAMSLQDYSPDEINVQREQVEAVRQAYPFHSLTWLKHPASRLDLLPLTELVESLRKPIAEVRPDVVFVPYQGDAHSDHRVVFDASLAVLKMFYMRSLGVARVLACETPSETNASPPVPGRVFVPNVYIDISEALERKLAIMSLYNTEVQRGHLPRGLSAISALARYRGSSIAAEYAEAFMLVQEIG
jgi:LmbE family N-acetylglucosaminyl deacetylase